MSVPWKELSLITWDTAGSAPATYLMLTHSDNYAVQRYSPVLAEPNAAKTGFQDVTETMDLLITGTTVLDCLAAGKVLKRVLEQAQQWRDGFPVSPVTLRAQRLYSSTYWDVVIVDGSVAGLQYDPEPNVPQCPGKYAIRVTLTLTRRGLWVKPPTSNTGGATVSSGLAITYTPVDAGTDYAIVTMTWRIPPPTGAYTIRNQTMIVTDTDGSYPVRFYEAETFSAGTNVLDANARGGQYKTVAAGASIVDSTALSLKRGSYLVMASIRAIGGTGLAQMTFPRPNTTALTLPPVVIEATATQAMVVLGFLDLGTDQTVFTGQTFFNVGSVSLAIDYFILVPIGPSTALIAMEDTTLITAMGAQPQMEWRTGYAGTTARLVPMTVLNAPFYVPNGLQIVVSHTGDGVLLAHNRNLTVVWHATDVEYGGVYRLNQFGGSLWLSTFTVTQYPASVQPE